MLTPVSGTLADYNSAILNGNATHARMVFPVQGITLTDDNISMSGGLNITDVLNADTDITFGKAVSRELSVNLINSSVFDTFDWSEEFRLDMGVDINGTTNWVTVGYFTGTKPQMYYGIKIIQFYAYDRMQKLDVLADDFLETLTYPATISSIYTALCTYFSLTGETGDAIADALSASFSESPFTGGMSCRALLAYIAEACGCYARITATGNVRLVWFTDHTADYSVDADDYYSISMNEVTTPVVDVMRVSCTYDNDIPGFVYPVGVDGEYYQIIDNPFLIHSASSATIAIFTAMLSRFSSFGSYRPMSMNIIGNWMVESGDVIEVGYGENETVNLPIFVRRFSWNGASRDVYECTGNIKRSKLSSDAKEEYKVNSKVAAKYTVRSGVDINDDGVTVSGGKYLKLISGGVLDVQAQDFSISSSTKIIKTGKWTIHPQYMKFIGGYPSGTFEGFLTHDITVVDSQSPVNSTFNFSYNTYSEDDQTFYNSTFALIGQRNTYENHEWINKTAGMQFETDFAKNKTFVTSLGDIEVGEESIPEEIVFNYSSFRVTGEYEESLSGKGVTGAVRMVGRLVTIDFGGTTSSSISSGTTIFTLPAAYRPVRQIHVYVGYSDSTSVVRFQINTSGTIVPGAALASGKAIRGHVAYISNYDAYA